MKRSRFYTVSVSDSNKSSFAKGKSRDQEIPSVKIGNCKSQGADFGGTVFILHYLQFSVCEILKREKAKC